MSVKDVAIRLGQGTASLALNRYYVLIEGPERDGTDGLIIEYKQTRRSELSGRVDNDIESVRRNCSPKT